MSMTRQISKPGTLKRCVLALAIALVLAGAIALQPSRANAQTNDRDSEDKGLQGT